MKSLLNVLLRKVWDGRCINFSCRSRRPTLFTHTLVFPLHQMLILSLCLSLL